MGVRSGQKTESMKQTPTPLLPPATHPCMAAPAQNALQAIRTHGWMSKNALRGAGDARVRAGQGTAKKPHSAEIWHAFAPHQRGRQARRLFPAVLLHATEGFCAMQVSARGYGGG